MKGLWLSAGVNSTPFAAKCVVFLNCQSSLYQLPSCFIYAIWPHPVSPRVLIRQQHCWGCKLSKMHWGHYSPAAISMFKMSHACSCASQNINQKLIKSGPKRSTPWSGYSKQRLDKAALSPRWQRETPRLWTHAMLSARGHYYWPWIGLRAGAKTEHAQSPVSNTD